MQPVDKFKTDLDQAIRRAEGSSAGAPDSLRSFFEREFPAIRGDTGDALYADFSEKWRVDPGAAATWLMTVGSILMQDYDGSTLSKDDWSGLREAFSAGAGELDLELLGYAMSLILEHGGL